MHSTPAVTLYGDNKESPYWYNKDHPSAEGVHSWVSNYADHFGYGYWDPDQYQGTSAIPYQSLHQMQVKDGIRRNGYGIGARYAVDTVRHNGALGKIGVATGHGGKGYSNSGKWIAGDQVTSVKSGKDEMVMLRRTVTKGGSLTGLAHKSPMAGKSKLGYAPKLAVSAHQ